MFYRTICYNYIYFILNIGGISANTASLICGCSEFNNLSNISLISENGYVVIE